MPRDRSVNPPEALNAATTQLQHLMAAAGVASYRALARQAEVSDWAVRQLRRDRIGTMRVEILQKLAAALGVSLPELLAHFGATDGVPLPPSEPKGHVRDDTQQVEALRQRIAALEAEYQRLQAQAAQQESRLQQQFRAAALAVLESWLVQWPTVTHAVAQNPELPASRLVPLVQPVQDLLAQWGVEAIAPVGAEVPFDPHQHQLMAGTAEPGDLVKVRYTGFRQGDTLLHRAKVSPVSP